MKKIILIMCVAAGLVLTSCGSERCPCNTFGKNTEVVKNVVVVSVVMPEAHQ